MMMGRGKSFCCCKKEKNKRQLERCFVGLKDVAERKEEDGGRRGHAYKSNKGEKADLFLLGREDDTLVLLLEPLLGVVLLDLVVESNAGLGSSALGDALSGAVEDDVEVHTVDTDGGIVLKTKIDVLVNTEAKVSGGAKLLSNSSNSLTRRPFSMSSRA